MKSIFSRILLLLAVIILFASCDKDVNDIGASVLGDDNFGFESYTGASVIAFTQKTDAVQTNNNSINQLGIYDNPVFGRTIANFATQLQLETLNPVIFNPTAVSITLDIPFLEPTATETSTATSFTYELNNIIGNKNSKIKLSVYRISKPFNPFDNSRNNAPQNYYSNNDIDSEIIGSRLNDGPISENDEFVLDKSERSVTVVTQENGTDKSVTTYSPPTLRLKLNASLLNDLKNTSASNLSNQYDFSQFYRGLYFKVEQSGSNAGFLTLLNFKAGKIKISYKGTSTLTADTAIQRPDIVLGFVNPSTFINAVPLISVNVLQQINKPDYANALANPNKIVGDDKLYVKGGNGSVVMLELFGKDQYGADGVSGTPNRIADELDIIRTKNWLINEANFVFYVDQATSQLLSSANNDEPYRISLYNVKTNTAITDLITDSSLGKLIYRGTAERNGSNVYKYKIRVTNFVRDLIKNGDKDIRLGLCTPINVDDLSFAASVNLNSITYANYLALSTIDKLSYFFPNSSISNPLGTVFYGSTNAVPSDKRLKLEIFYSKPN